MPRHFLFLLVFCFVAPQGHADGGVVEVDAVGDLHVTPLAGRTVFVQGVDVPATSLAVNERLRALEAVLQIPNGPPATSGLPPMDRAARIEHDSLGNLLLIPATSSQKKKKNTK